MMNVSTNLIVIMIYNIKMCQIITLYTSNLQCSASVIYLNKVGGRGGKGNFVILRPYRWC